VLLLHYLAHQPGDVTTGSRVGRRRWYGFPRDQCVKYSLQPPAICLVPGVWQQSKTLGDLLRVSTVQYSARSSNRLRVRSNRIRTVNLRRSKSQKANCWYRVEIQVCCVCVQH